MLSILIVGLAIAALLYFWLRGHSFARVLAFAALAVMVAGGTLLFGAPDRPHETFSVPVAIGGLCALALAWPVSGIPARFRRRQINTG
jgi:hypothetical protein